MANELMNYKVYIHTTPVGKYYVGITKQELKNRWKKGKGYTNNSHFTNAINKYGWDNIDNELIADGITRKEAMNFEKILIDKLRSNEQEYGYNKSIGGESKTGAKVSDKTKKLISGKMIELWEDEGYRNHMETALKERFKDVEYLENHSNIRKGTCMNEEHHASKEVLCITTGKVFPSASEAGRFYGIQYKNILTVCNRTSNRVHAGKHDGKKLKWRFL